MSSDEESVQYVSGGDLEIIQESNNDENEAVMENEPHEIISTENNEQDEENKKIVKPKKRVKNPQPKLNALTLMGRRGLTTVESYFDRVKFKGKGHEEQDLNVLMKTYEYWCHRLFPKYPFDACISRLETLGTKKATITYIKKIRMGIADEVEDKPIVSDDELVEDPTTGSGFVNEVNDQFDQLLQPDSYSGPTDNAQLSEQQLKQICQNRERAERIRKEKLQKIRERSTSFLPINTQQSEDILPSCSFEENSVTTTETVRLNDLSVKNIENDVQTTQKKAKLQLIDSDENDQEINVENESTCKEFQIINLTNEQRERIHQNRERAEKLKQSKLQKQQNIIGNVSVIPNKATIVVDNNINAGTADSKNGVNCSTEHCINVDNEPISDDENDEVDLEEMLNIINVNEDINAGTADSKNGVNCSTEHCINVDNEPISDDENDEVDLEEMLNIINVNEDSENQQICDNIF